MSAGRFLETVFPTYGNAGHSGPAPQKSCRTILVTKTKYYQSRSPVFVLKQKPSVVSPRDSLSQNFFRYNLLLIYLILLPY
ncbi:Uncharacterized protein dnm_027430 [Desulfonema magnum]|uniref:Uncharacterized protein n=1 Tax=Desulfonema magnum TaxID=45655 RepID=A0A975BJ71_9BACT|nr:Uncharacterized protein dnm_027430 [Desulfonema magnum]